MSETAAQDNAPIRANGSCKFIEGAGDQTQTTTKKSSSTVDELNLTNPFVNSLVPATPAQCIQTIVNTFLLVPIRIVFIILFLLLTWLMAVIGLWGLSKEDIAKKPLSGWRKSVQSVAKLFMRLVFVAGTIHWVTVKGKQASAKEAPIVVVAPHSSFYDSIVAVMFGPPGVVAKAETSSLPFFGKIIDLSQPIYVCREDPDSRNTTIQAIKNRANSPEDWPPLMIFPEGTCTNREALISFKLGAFFPGVPIQPIVIRYPNRYDSFTWTWSGPGPMQLLWLTLTKGFTRVEVEYLPVYVPSEEEKANPKLFAKNVQKVMSKALEIPISDYTYNDCKTLARAKDMGLKRFLRTAEVDKLRQMIGLNRTNVEEQIISSSLVNSSNYQMKYGDFCIRLQIPQNDVTRRLFEIFLSLDEKEKITDLSSGDAKEQEALIDFREYLLCAIFLIKFKRPVIELIELAFKLYGGSVSKKEFVRKICLLLGRRKLGKDENAQKLYEDMKKEVTEEERVTFDEFSKYVEQKPKYSYLFTTPKEIAP